MSDHAHAAAHSQHAPNDHGSHHAHGTPVKEMDFWHLPGFSRLLILFGLMWLFLFWVTGGAVFWPLIMVLLASSVILQAYIIDTRPFTRKVIEDNIFKGMRTLGRGWRPIGPGESVYRTIDLKQEVKVNQEESFPTKRGRVITKYLFIAVPDDSSDSQLLKYSSFEDHAIQDAAHGYLSSLLSDYFRNKTEDEHIMNKAYITRVVLDTQNVRDFAKDHGVRILEARLVDVDWDEEVQRYRNALAGIQNFGEGKKMLVEQFGVSPEDAEEYVLLYSRQNVQKNIFEANVQGLPSNLRDVAIGWVPPGGGDKGKEKGKK